MRLKGVLGKNKFLLFSPMVVVFTALTEVQKNQAEQFVVYEENVDNDKGKIFN